MLNIKIIVIAIIYYIMYKTNVIINISSKYNDNILSSNDIILKNCKIL